MFARKYRKIGRLAKLALTHPFMFRIMLRLRGFTMVPKITYINNLRLASRMQDVQGAIVECGTWKGGMIAGIACCLGNKRNYLLFDSFEGLPVAGELDGNAAIEWQKNTTDDLFHDNCSASMEEAARAMALANIQAPRLIKGWFKDTLPNFSIPEGIAILRMDGDCYESTIEILDNFFPQVLPGGLIIIDDYYTWDGYTRAVHDYLSKHKRPERIRSYEGICYLEKVDT
jgi:hypothetical protein